MADLTPEELDAVRAYADPRIIPGPRYIDIHGLILRLADEVERHRAASPEVRRALRVLKALPMRHRLTDYAAVVEDCQEPILGTNASEQRIRMHWREDRRLLIELLDALAIALADSPRTGGEKEESN